MEFIDFGAINSRMYSVATPVFSKDGGGTGGGSLSRLWEAVAEC